MTYTLAHSTDGAAVNGMSLVISIGACLTIRSNGGHDEMLVYLTEAGIVEAELIHNLRGVVLHENVGVLEQPCEC